MTHHIQQKILKALLYAEALNYAQMQPEGIESNQFAYHLKQLVRTGLVDKKGQRYSLSPAGLALVDRLSQEKMVDRLQPHIVTAIDITTDDGRVLVFRRGFQPYIHRYGLVLGKIHFEETLQEAAERELWEKAGMTGVPLIHRGLVYLESKIDGVTISKVMYHLFSGHTAQPWQTPASFRGHCEWVRLTEVQPEQAMPGFLAMKRLLSAHTSFFYKELSEEQCHVSTVEQ